MGLQENDWAAVVQQSRPVGGFGHLRIRYDGKLTSEISDTPEVITQKMRLAFRILSMSNERHWA